MTKREHDAATKWNYGAVMAGDTRGYYRRDRGVPQNAREDWIARRASEAKASGLPTLARGSKFRSIAEYRAKHGPSMLGARK